MEQFFIDALRDSPASLITGVIIFFAIRPGIAAMQQTLNIMLAQVNADAAKDKGESTIQQSQLALMNTLAVGNQDVVRETTNSIRALTNAVQNNNSLTTSMRAEQLSHTPFLMKIPDIVTKADGIAKQLSETHEHLNNRFDDTDRALREGFESFRDHLTGMLSQVNNVIDILRVKHDETTPQPDNTAPPPGLESGESQQDSAVVESV